MIPDKNGWIKIEGEDTLPEKGIEVLIFEPNNPNEPEEGIKAVSYYEKTIKKEKYRGYIRDIYLFPDYQDEISSYFYATHWQPLPENPII